ncbi:hypothetical protein KIL84_007426 [Mauremys mutica]|uniref:Uncharacterized protein n=1 Tax=Mauremys mutica TaxID=74926 RepID=A0A9D4AV18_9SAUR|nr:hypothetical protein KIL84_007426 [Mauremys mutica]
MSLPSSLALNSGKAACYGEGRYPSVSVGCSEGKVAWLECHCTPAISSCRMALYGFSELHQEPRYALVGHEIREEQRWLQDTLSNPFSCSDKKSRLSVQTDHWQILGLLSRIV